MLINFDPSRIMFTAYRNLFQPFPNNAVIWNNTPTCYEQHQLPKPNILSWSSSFLSLIIVSMIWVSEKLKLRRWWNLEYGLLSVIWTMDNGSLGVHPSLKEVRLNCPIRMRPLYTWHWLSVDVNGEVELVNLLPEMKKGERWHFQWLPHFLQTTKIPFSSLTCN